MTSISGNTYPVKDQLKALGGRWNAAEKCWMVPDNRADEARKLVSGATSSPKPRYSKCHDCGATTRGYYRCYDCSMEYKDGGSRHKGGMSYYDKDGHFVLGDDD